jgi:tetratricopeptide (TPR) repeat protein
MSLLSNDSRHKNQLASDWMHRGMDLANENSEATLEQAVRCFDEAIALRRTLPLDENHFFRYGLSAGWINRGDAMMRFGTNRSLAEAVKSYDEALILLESLPLKENALYPRRLAIAWINRGFALQKQEAPHDLWEATACFREAIEVLESPEANEVTDRASLLAGAWINLAEAFMSSDQEDAETIRSAARKALALVLPSERLDLVSAEIGSKGRHLLCRLAVRDIAGKRPLSKPSASEATDAVDETLALVRHWKLQGQGKLPTLALEIFRFGCRLYENSQPHFLAEFLTECLAPELFGEAILPDQETLDAAHAAIWGALGNLQLDGFHLISTSQFEPFLADIQELREVEERLNQLRLVPAA